MRARIIKILWCSSAIWTLCGCGATPPPLAPSLPPAPIQTQTPQPPCPAPQLEKQFAEIAGVTQGPVGATVMLVETGDTVSLKPTDHFPMQSVYKLPIAMMVLNRLDSGTLTLDQKVKVEPKDFVGSREYTIPYEYPRGAELSVRELLRFMMSESDGTACDVLMRLMGGPPEVTKHIQGLSVDGIVLATYEKEMAQNRSVSYQNWSTPQAMAALLKMLHEAIGVSTTSRDLLLDLMIGSRPGPKRIKGELPSEAVVAHKTGTSGTAQGVTSATNDVGLITLPDGRHLAIAVFVSDTKANQETREGVIAKIARAAWDCWMLPSQK